jgi:hypothetical protein
MPCMVLSSISRRGIHSSTCVRRRSDSGATPETCVGCRARSRGEIGVPKSRPYHTLAGEFSWH